jgi:hypothetical protein
VSAGPDESTLSPAAAHLRAIFAALEGPSEDELRPWVTLARDCDGIAEFFERAALLDEATALAHERWFYAERGRCPRCGARDVTSVYQTGNNPRSRPQRCAPCAIAWSQEEHRARVAGDWAAAVMVAARAARIESAERLARQVNESLAAFDEPHASAFEWVISDAIDGESVYDLRAGSVLTGKPSSLTRAVSRGRTLSPLNPVVLCDEVAMVQTVPPMAVEIARDLVALDGWARARPTSNEHTAFAALDALYAEGAIYQGVDDGRVRLRALWRCPQDIVRVLPREVPVW